MGILDFLTGGGIGAIAGAIGGIAGKVYDLKLEAQKLEALKIENDFKLAMRQKDMELAAQEAQAQFQIHKVDTDAQVVVADLASLQKSVEADKATYGDTWMGRVVDFIRGSTRPVITYFAMWLVIASAYKVLRSTTFTPEQGMQVLDQVLFLSGTAIGWWFGARVSTPSRR